MREFFGGKKAHRHHRNEFLSFVMCTPYNPPQMECGLEQNETVSIIGNPAHVLAPFCHRLEQAGSTTFRLSVKPSGLEPKVDYTVGMASRRPVLTMCQWR